MIPTTFLSNYITHFLRSSYSCLLALFHCAFFRFTKVFFLCACASTFGPLNVKNIFFLFACFCLIYNILSCFMAHSVLDTFDQLTEEHSAWDILRLSAKNIVRLWQSFEHPWFSKKLFDSRQMPCKRSRWSRLVHLLRQFLSFHRFDSKWHYDSR